jgi:hypothetical protein
MARGLSTELLGAAAQVPDFGLIRQAGPIVFAIVVKLGNLE